MAMDDIILKTAFRREPQDPICKFSDVRGKLLLGKGDFRTGRDVDHPVAVSKVMEYMWDMLVL
jgi:hypothetical protein